MCIFNLCIVRKLLFLHNDLKHAKPSYKTSFTIVYTLYIYDQDPQKDIVTHTFLT